MIVGLRNSALDYANDIISKTRAKIMQMEAQVAEAENELEKGSIALSQYRVDRLERARNEVSRYVGQLRSFDM